MVRRASAGLGSAVLLVADAGPLLVLGLAELLPSTALTFGPLAVPQAVLDECLTQPGLPGENSIRQGLARRQLLPVATQALSTAASLSHGLGAGEAAVLDYARLHQLTALIDDRRARQTARRLALPSIGSGAVLLGLKRAGRIDSVRDVLALWSGHGYFIGAAVREALLAAAGEAPREEFSEKPE